MLALASLIHYGTIALTVTATAVGVGIGQGLTCKNALIAMNEQPTARDDIARSAMLGMALIETAAILGVLVSLIVLWSARNHVGMPYAHIAEIGIALAISLPGLVLGIISALPAQAASMSIARQPFFAQKIMRFMLLSLSLIQTPIVFGLIVAIFIKGQAANAASLADSLRLIAAGLSIGLGSLGPAVGLALFAQAACASVGVNRKAFNKLLSFTFISQAIIETPIILCLVVSLFMLFSVSPLPSYNMFDGVALLAASICIGFGTMGPGISSGKVAGVAARQIAFNLEQYGLLSRLSMFSQGLLETSAIYSFLITLLLIFLR